MAHILFPKYMFTNYWYIKQFKKYVRNRYTVQGISPSQRILLLYFIFFTFNSTYLLHDYNLGFIIYIIIIKHLYTSTIHIIRPHPSGRPLNHDKNYI